jgi:RNA-binding protein 5/10
MQVREIRLVRTKGDLTSRGFAFVEFHSLAAARAILAAAEPIVVDGVAVRVSFAREPKTSSSGGSSHPVAFGGTEQLPEVARERYAERLESHQGPKRSGFGIPSGFVPDQSTGYYFSAATGYYYDATTKLYYHPATTLW